MDTTIHLFSKKSNIHAHGLAIGVWLTNITASAAVFTESNKHTPLEPLDSTLAGNLITETGASQVRSENI